MTSSKWEVFVSVYRSFSGSFWQVRFIGSDSPFGGFFSKERILLSTFSHPEPIYKVLAVVAEIGALITVLYTFRMFFIAFWRDLLSAMMLQRKI